MKTLIYAVLLLGAVSVSAATLRVVNATGGVAAVNIGGTFNDWIEAGGSRTYDAVPQGSSTVTATAADGQSATATYAFSSGSTYSLAFMPAAGGTVTLNMAENTLTANYLAVFLKGFAVGMVWELFGLLLRIVRKTATQTTGL